MCIIANQEKADFDYFFDKYNGRHGFFRRPRHLREDPLQPPSCGADDFSEGAEHLTQKVLWEAKNRGEEKKKKEKRKIWINGANSGFLRGAVQSQEKRKSPVITKECPINFRKLWLWDSPPERRDG